jgi:hypothetical protein
VPTPESSTADETGTAETSTGESSAEETSAEETSTEETTSTEPAPAFLVVREIVSLPELIPGTPGAFTLTVTNEGGSPSDRTQIDVLNLPTGVSISSITVDGSLACDAKSAGSCVLRTLKPGESAVLVVAVLTSKDFDAGRLLLQIGEATLTEDVKFVPVDTPETITGKVDDVDAAPSDLPPADTGETPSN